MTECFQVFEYFSQISCFEKMYKHEVQLEISKSVHQGAVIAVISTNRHISFYTNNKHQQH